MVHGISAGVVDTYLRLCVVTVPASAPRYVTTAVKLWPSVSIIPIVLSSRGGITGTAVSVSVGTAVVVVVVAAEVRTKTRPSWLLHISRKFVSSWASPEI